MTSTGWGILIGYTALSLIGITIGLIVFRSTRVGFRVRSVRRQALERRETLWGLAVIVFLLAVLGGTIFQVPYFEDTKAASAGQQQLKITGRQFAWTINPPRVRAGVETVVELRSADVSHAVGFYNPDDTLVQQVNILPGKVQRFTITFEHPGTYTLRCLEFCGLDHHLMEGNLQVTR